MKPAKISPPNCTMDNPKDWLMMRASRPVHSTPRALREARIHLPAKAGLVAAAVMVAAVTSGRARAVEAGPAWHDFPTTLQPGAGTEVLGPVWGHEKIDGAWTWRLSPLISHHEDAATERSEYEVLYPVFTYDRFGTEYAARFLQFLQITGSTTVNDESKKRTTIFPFFFHQKSTSPTNGYFAVLPFYGHLRNRLFRDEVTFILAPLWVSSTKRDVQTDNLMFPFFHWRHGGGVRGWQAWPLAGAETKEITYRLNNLDEKEVVPGHDRKFFALPFFIHEKTGLGSENPVTNLFFFPTYTRTRSPAMDYTSVLFFGHRTNRVEQFSEWGTPWPFIGWANGPGKTARRLWPLFGHARSPSQSSDFALWPLYTHRGQHSPSFQRDRTRLLYFAYSNQRMVNPASGEEFRRRDLWPLFTYRHDLNGQERLQILAPVEPLLPNNKSIERLYTPLWSLYRAESDPKTGHSSQSLLWNLWRRDVHAEKRRTSLLFGAIKTEKSESGRKWRFFWRPMEPRPTAAASSP